MKCQDEQTFVVGKLNHVLLKEMVAASENTDAHYVHDLLEGFPVTETVGTGGLGEQIPGGQRSNGRKGDGAAPDLNNLRAQCRGINEATVRRAMRRIPENAKDLELSQRVWGKIQSDIDAGRSGEPVDVEFLDMDEILLVEVFGVWEQHGEALMAKVREIYNFKANRVNDHAWMPNKIRYDHFAELLVSLQILYSVLVQAKPPRKSSPSLVVGKQDFKSAFKTLPASRQHAWLCWALAYNPHLGKLQAVPLWTQVFGSLGGVTAWYRTAKAIQRIMLKLFHCVLFFYVDDAFWPGSRQPST